MGEKLRNRGTRQEASYYERGSSKSPYLSLCNVCYVMRYCGFKHTRLCMFNYDNESTDTWRHENKILVRQQMGVLDI